MSGSFLHQLFWVLMFSGALLFCLGWWSHAYAGWDALDTFIQLTNPTRQANAVSDAEEVSIVITNLIGIFLLNGVILTIFINWVTNRKDRHIKGLARYSYIQNGRFAVIIGAHEMVSTLVKSLLDKGSLDYILVQTRRDPETVRKEINAFISDKLAKKVVIYAGNRTSWLELKALKLHKAQEIYLIGEPYYIDKSSHDAINMQCWHEIVTHIKLTLTQRIPCHVMFEYQSTFSAFQFTDLRIEESSSFRFIPFSIYEIWAQQVLIGENKSDRSNNYIPLDGWGGLNFSSHQRTHFIIAGMSKMGMALAIEAAQIAHYPNFNNPHTGRPRTLITFIDRNARREMLFFMGRFRDLFQLARWRFVKAPDGDTTCENSEAWNIYDTSKQIANRTNKAYPWHDPMTDADLHSPYYDGYLGNNLIDIDFEFIEGDVALPSIQKYIKEAAADNSQRIVRLSAKQGVPLVDDSSRTTIAICFPVAAEAMSAALYFDPSVYQNAQQILVEQSQSGALVNAIKEGHTGEDNSRFSVLRPFGMIDRCDYLKGINNYLPKIVAYAYHCLDKGSSLMTEYNNSANLNELKRAINGHWDSIKQNKGKSAVAQRWSNLYCANSFDSKIRASGIDLTSSDVIRDPMIIEQLAKVEHNRWVIEQLLLGYRPVDSSYATELPLDEKDSRRRDLKNKNIHPDIISNELLGTTKHYDKELVKILPLATFLSKQFSTAISDN